MIHTQIQNITKKWFDCWVLLIFWHILAVEWNWTQYIGTQQKCDFFLHRIILMILPLKDITSKSTFLQHIKKECENRNPLQSSQQFLHFYVTLWEKVKVQFTIWPAMWTVISFLFLNQPEKDLATTPIKSCAWWGISKKRSQAYKSCPLSIPVITSHSRFYNVLCTINQYADERGSWG